MVKDFTLDKYEQLCRFITASDREIVTLSNFFSNKKKYDKKSIIILRHDVDHFPGKALKMSILEKRHGIKSTYYFRSRKHVFRKTIIDKILSFGHEIGYHYENLADADGNFKKAILMFENDLNEFRDITEIKTIAMHGSSRSRYDNKEIWNHYSMHDYGIIADAYLSIDWSKVCYFTDTGGSWNSDVNIRDSSGSENNIPISSTNDLMYFIYKNKNKTIYLSTHPDRWNNGISWYLEFGTKKIRNYAKNLYRGHITK